MILCRTWSMLESDQVQCGRAELQHEPRGFDGNVERGYSVLVSVMLFEQVIFGSGAAR